MNKFITTDVGGLPIVLDDFRFIDDSVREAFFGIVTAWGVANEESYILSGCEITLGVNISVAAGYVVIQGEVYKFNAQSITGTAPSGEEVTFVPSTAFDSAGNKTFDSGGTFDTYQLRTAALQYNIIAATNFKLFAALTIHEKIAEASAPYLGAWTTINLNGSTDVVQNTFASGGGTDTATVLPPVSGDYLMYNIIGKTVHLKWSFSIRTTMFSTASARSILIKNLPFTFANIDQFDSYSAKTNTSENGLSGQNECFTIAASQTLGFKLNTLGGNNGEFNRFYIFDPSGNTAVDATADVSQEFTWEITGGGAFVLD